MKTFIFLITMVVVSSCGRSVSQYGKNGDNSYRREGFTIFRKCLNNDQCPQGRKCKEGYCRDIYQDTLN